MQQKIIEQNFEKIKKLYFGNKDSEYRKQLKNMFGKCSISVLKNGVTVITFPNNDRLFLDPDMVEYKRVEGNAFTKWWEE